MWTAKRFVVPMLKRALNVIQLREKPIAKPAAVEVAK